MQFKHEHAIRTTKRFTDARSRASDIGAGVPICNGLDGDTHEHAHHRDGQGLCFLPDRRVLPPLHSAGFARPPTEGDGDGPSARSAMNRSIGSIALVVADYDEAIAYYTQALGFVLLEDVDQGGGKRWVRVAPAGGAQTALLLAQAVGEEQGSRIGNQTGGRVGFFLHTDDFWRDHAAMVGHGVRFMETPRVETYGTVAVFEDLYGNRWDLLELKA